MLDKKIKVFFFKPPSGNEPVKDWLKALPSGKETPEHSFERRYFR